MENGRNLALKFWRRNHELRNEKEGKVVRKGGMQALF